jgi:hypothetical protein
VVVPSSTGKYQNGQWTLTLEDGNTVLSGNVGHQSLGDTVKYHRRTETLGIGSDEALGSAAREVDIAVLLGLRFLL